MGGILGGEVFVTSWEVLDGEWSCYLFIAIPPGDVLIDRRLLLYDIARVARIFWIPEPKEPPKPVL